MAEQSREAKARKKATDSGYTLEKGKGGFVLVDASTGTWVAAAWSSADGFGLILDDVETALDA